MINQSLERNISSKEKFEIIRTLSTNFRSFQITPEVVEVSSSKESFSSESKEEENEVITLQSRTLTKNYDISSTSSEESSELFKRHKNKPWDKEDHTFRTDVRSKTILRKLISVVRIHFSKEMKGRGKADKMFKNLKKLLLEQYSDLRNDENLFFSIFSNIWKMIFKKKEENITNSNFLSDVEKERMKYEIDLFDEMHGDFSIAK